MLHFSLTHGKVLPSAHARRSVPTPSRSVRARQLVNRVVAHGPAATSEAPSGTPRVKPEKEKGFINEMRMVAMRLHTRDQAPKEGKAEPAPAHQPMQQWNPTREGYLRFLAESKVVYDTLEGIVSDPANKQFSALAKTGLERSAALAKDIDWFQTTYKLQAPQPSEEGPGHTYAKKVAGLAKSDPQAFICHYYNFYFAHTAGGRMIGSKIAQTLLDNKSLAFYEYEGDVQEHLDAVRASINKLAEEWTPDQKKHCLEETGESFKMSGQIMRCITDAAAH